MARTLTGFRAKAIMRGAFLVALVLLLPVARGTAFAVSVTVNSTQDAVDVDPGDGVCETLPGNGICSLRAAVQETNALPGPDTVILPAGTYQLTQVGDDDLSAVGDLDITDNLTIAGAGVLSTTITDSPGIEGVIDVWKAPSGRAATLYLPNVTIHHAASGVRTPGGELNLSNSTVAIVAGKWGVRRCSLDLPVSAAPVSQSNMGGVCVGYSGVLYATDSNIGGVEGGGDLFSGATLSTTRCALGYVDGTFCCNIDTSSVTGVLRGAACWSYIRNSNIDGAIETSGGLAISGSTIRGAVANYGYPVQISNSTISGGGGCVNNGYGFGNEVSIANSTISGNAGGGIRNLVPAATSHMVLQSGTIAGNAGGGGISNVPAGLIQVTRSIIANNTASNGQPADCGGTLTSGGGGS